MRRGLPPVLVPAATLAVAFLVVPLVVLVAQVSWTRLPALLTTPADDVMFIPLCGRCVDGLAVAHSATKRPDWPDAPKSHTIT